MIIKRMVNGQEMEFELTNAEIGQAYREYDECSIREDLETILRDNFDDEIELSKAELTTAMYLFKKYRSNSDEWRYDAESAINVVLSERGNK